MFRTTDRREPLQICLGVGTRESCREGCFFRLLENLSNNPYRLIAIILEYTFQYIFTNDNSDGQVNFEVIFSDSAGNFGDTVTGTTNSSYTIFDKVPPSDFTVQDVITVGENSIANAWNSTNSAININIPVSDDESLDSGRVQIIAKVANNDFENLDSYHFFQSSDLNNSKIVSVSESLVESI